MIQPPSLARDGVTIARGIAIGAADAVPGISGGTVALVLGIYPRLVAAIGRFDTTLISLLRSREWNAAAQHIDLRFLVTLAAGILLGVSLLARLVDYLLHNQLQGTLAVFFGLTVASVLIVLRMITRWRLIEFVGIIVGTLFAFWLVRLPALQHPPDSLTYLFLCGTVAICAMILPGISGAFILLILGKYLFVLTLVRQTLHFEITPPGLLALGIFASGCVIGLLSFSKFLKWLLARYEPTTLATLAGFMVGSLWRLWPFQVLQENQPRGMLLTEHIPWNEIRYDGHFWLSVLLIVVSMLVVFALDLTRARLIQSVHKHTEA